MKGFTCLIVSILFLGVVNALDCITCDSKREGEKYCSHEPFKKPSKDKVMSCSVSFTYAFDEFKDNFQGGQNKSELDSCVKHVYKDEHGKVDRVVRGCASGYEDVCKMFEQNSQSHKYMCYACKQKYCNAATSLTSALFVTIGVIIFSFTI